MALGHLSCSARCKNTLFGEWQKVRGARDIPLGAEKYREPETLRFRRTPLKQVMNQT